MADLIIFDFDGTLADSERLMFDSLNALSGEFGFPLLMEDEIPRLRKMSVYEFASKRLRIPLWNLWKLLRLEKRGKQEFAFRAGALHIFPGIADVVAHLRESGRTVGIISSAAQDIVEKVASDGGIEVDFINASTGILGKARVIRRALRKYEIPGNRAVYVGDEIRDVRASKKAGVGMLAVSWGLNDEASLRKVGADVARTPQELLKKLMEQK